MGVDHWFYLIKAAKYYQIIRPSYKKQFHLICPFSIINQERRRLQAAGAINQLIDMITKPTYKYQKSSKGPVQTFIQKQKQIIKLQKSQQRKKQKAIKKQKEYEQQMKIHNFLKQNSIVVQSIRNHFLRHENFLQTIDLYQGQGNNTKVSNLYQVQNYIDYLQFVQKALKNYQGQWERQYSDVDQALQKFKQIYKSMKKNDKELLIFSSG